MRAVQLTQTGGALTEADIDLPVADTGEVIVRVSHCGLCHTDVHLRAGYFGLGGDARLNLKQQLPLTLGHEIAGVAHAVGQGVEPSWVGRPVAVYPWIGCGKCPVCARGDEHLCGRARAIGVNVDGGYAQYVRVPHEQYLLDIDGIDPQFAAILMCSGLSAYSAVDKAAGAFSRGEALILGYGGLGRMAVEIAAARFDAAPMVIERSDTGVADAIARGLRAYATDTPDLRKIIERECGRPAAVVDFVGSSESAALANRLLGQGGRLISVGLFGGSLTVPLPLLALRGTQIVGSYVGTLEDARAVLALARSGRLKPIPTLACGVHELDARLDDLEVGKAPGRFVLNF